MTAPLDPAAFDVLTFDCYGTLIDWEAGLLAALRRCIALDPIRGVDVTVSFGVSAWAGRGEFDFPALFDRADAALYAAKQGGRNRVACAGDDRQAAALQAA